MEFRISKDELVTQLVEIGIVTVDDLESLTGVDTCRTADELAALLIQGNKLTDLQCGRIAAGEGETLRFDRYILQQQIGSGGMGEVYLGRDIRMKRKVAVKILPPANAADQSSIERFQREIEAVAHLNHPNIVSAYDANEQNGRKFLVLELVQGVNLGAWIGERGPMQFRQALRTIRQVANGLEYAHQRGIIHRDIKPSNLMLGGNDEVKILDLGLARMTTPPEGSENELTRTGAALGTVDYMSPEQIINSKNADARSDIYSLGSVLFFLLTGRPVFPRDSVVNRMLAIRKDEPPILREVRDDIPDDVNALYLRMVAKDPADRLQSASDVVAAIDQILEVTTTSRRAVDMPTKPLAMSAHSQPRRFHRIGIIATTVAALAIASVGIPLMSGKGDPIVDLSGEAAVDVNTNDEDSAGPPDTGSVVDQPMAAASHQYKIPELVLVFDGADDFLEATSFDYDFSHPITIEAWCTVPSVRFDHGPIVSIGSVLNLSNDSGGKWMFSATAAERSIRAFSDESQFAGTIHLAATYDGAHPRLFVNGAEQEHFKEWSSVTKDQRDIDRSASITLAIATDLPPLRIGGPGSNAMGFWQGAIHEVRISNRVRYTTSFKPPPDLASDAATMAAYRFDGRSKESVEDLSGNAHVLAMTGTKWVSRQQYTARLIRDFQVPSRADGEPPRANAPFNAKRATAHQEAWADYLGVPMEQSIDLGDGQLMNLVLIPPGEYIMGTPSWVLGRQFAAANDEAARTRLKREMPHHLVRITQPFYLSRHEITRGQFSQFVASTNYVTDAERDGDGGSGLQDGRFVQTPDYLWNTYLGFDQTDQHPVVNVSTNDAQAFCEWLSGQMNGLRIALPTEAQWEYACRAGTSSLWSCGNEDDRLDDYAWTSANSGSSSHAVGQRLPNPFGLFDMHGNVNELCGDAWSVNGYAIAIVNDPMRINGTRRPRRGGSFASSRDWARSAFRRNIGPTERFATDGFRIAVSLSDGHGLSADRFNTDL